MGNTAKLIIAILIPLCVGFTSGFFTAGNVSGWYQTIQKPSWNPPSWIFGPVWTTLYALMAVAVWRIGVPRSAAQKRAVVLFVVQLLLNGIWSPAFFGLESPLLGLIIIVPMWIAIAMTLVAFWRLDRTAGLLMAPYLLWVSYATMLNGAIYALN